MSAGVLALGAIIANVATAGDVVLIDGSLLSSGSTSYGTVSFGTIGSGTLNSGISPDNIFTAATINVGTVVGGPALLSAAITDSTGVFNVTNLNVTAGTFSVNGSRSGVADSGTFNVTNLNIASGGLLAATGTSTVTVSAGASAGLIADTESGAGDSSNPLSIVKTSAGRLSISGDNTYTGGTTLKEGILSYTHAATGAYPLGTGILTISGGQLVSEGTSALTNLIAITDLAATLGTVSVKLGEVVAPSNVIGATPIKTELAGDISLDDNVAFNVLSATTLSGTISSTGTQNISVTGAGVLTISGANTFTGDTTIRKGTVTAGHTEAFGSDLTNRVVILDGGALNAGNALPGVGIIKNEIVLGDSSRSDSVNVTLSGVLDGGTIKQSAVTLAQNAIINVATGADLSVLTGTITGAGKSLTKVGEGTLSVGDVSGIVSLSGGTFDLSLHSDKVATLAYTGNTNLNEGVLAIEGLVVNGATSKIVFNGGVLDLTAAARFVDDGSAITSIDYATAIGAIPKGQSAIIKAADVFDSTGAVVRESVADGTGGTVFTAGLSGEGGLWLQQGVLTVGSVNAYTGATKVTDGSANGTTGSLSALKLASKTSIATSSSVSVGANAILDASADGFTFKTTQPVTIEAQGKFKTDPAKTNFTDASLFVDPTSDLYAAIVLTGANGSTTQPIELNLKAKANPLYSFTPRLERAGNIDSSNYVVADTGVTLGAVTGTVAYDKSPLYTLYSSGGNVYTSRTSYASFAVTPTTKSLGTYLDQQIVTVGSGNSSVWNHLANTVEPTLTTAAQYTEFLNQNSAQPFADMYRSGLERALAVLGGLEDRLTSIATAGSEEGSSRKFGYKQMAPHSHPAGPSKAADDEWSAWLSVYERSGNDKSVGEGASKLHNSEAGTQMGVERQLGGLKVGLIGATGWGRSSFDKPDAQISSDSWHVGIYTIAPIDKLSLDASFIYGLTSNSSSRTPHVNSLLGSTLPDTTYHGKFDSRDLSISVGVAYNLMQAGSAFQMAPVLRLSYVNYNQSAFSEFESNVGAQQVGSMSSGSFLSKLGYRTSYTLRSGSTEFGADLGAYWQHDWNTESRSLSSSFVGGLAGTSYTATGRKGTSDSALINGGLQIMFNDKYTLRASAGVEFGGERENLNGTVTFGIKF